MMPACCMTPIKTLGSPKTNTRLQQIGQLAAIACLSLAGSTWVCAQSVKPGTPATISQAPLVEPSKVPWYKLTSVQKEALMPLESRWDALAQAHQSKWLVIAQGFAALNSADQEKLHNRMADWAALSPRDRELARLNFAESKKTPTTDRAAKWEQYQALSPEEKQRLAKQAMNKPASAATATKPATPNQLAIVPVTRNTAPEVRDQLKTKPKLNPKTALPQPAATAPAAEQPVQTTPISF